MQSAFGFSSPGPTTGTRVFARANGTSAMSAANARVVEIMQRVVRNTVLVNVVPNVLIRPVSNRIDFDEPELPIPFNLFRGSPEYSLIATDRRDPGSQFCELLFQRLNLAQSAALIWIGAP